MGKSRSIWKRLETPFQWLRQIAEIIRLCGRRFPRFSKIYFRSIGRGISLCLTRGYLPEEGDWFGLFDPDLSREKLSQFLSKKKLMKIQKGLNPASWSHVTEDKGIFYIYCKALGIPIPCLYGIFFRETPGWCLKGWRLVSREDWKRYLEEGVDGEFVIKPSRGVFGHKVKIFSRSDGEFQEASGQSYTSEDIYEMMFQDPEYDRFIIQERLKNHPDLSPVLARSFLQTVRVVTFIDKKGACHILLAGFRILGGKNIIDNFASGRSGNMMAPISLETGILKPARARENLSLPFREETIHPITGNRIEGFHLPLWEDCRALAKESAFKFLPVRTTGWDIALTPKGPVIVEANMWWNPANAYASMDAVLTEMEQ